MSKDERIAMYAKKDGRKHGWRQSPFGMWYIISTSPLQARVTANFDDVLIEIFPGRLYSVGRTVTKNTELVVYS